MDFDLDRFSYRLNALLEDNNITQTALSRKIGISNVTISRYVTGERSPRVDVITKIAGFFNVSIDYLLGRSDDISLKHSADDLDFNIDFYIRNLYGFSDKAHITKKQINAINKLLLANQEFIMFAK